MPAPEYFDVIIIGAGPAGLMAALWMSRRGVKTLLVDKRSADTRNGLADGIQARTLEILDSFGLVDPVWNESYHLGEDHGEDGKIRRSSRMPNTIPHLSYFPQGVILSQHRIEEMLLASLALYPQIEMQRGLTPVSLEYDASETEVDLAFPITLSLRPVKKKRSMRRLSSTPLLPCPFAQARLVKPLEINQPGGKIISTLSSEPLIRYTVQPTLDYSVSSEVLMRKRQRMNHPINKCSSESTLHDKSPAKKDAIHMVKAKYMIGCDGAHSWIRNQLGIQMKGEQTDYIWGVIDIVPITNFPDIRSRCAIHSAESGNIMLIPREGRLVRLYCQLKKIEIGQEARFDRSKITEETIFKTAQEIFKPYTLEYKYCDNWTVYQVGQRVGERFSVDNRIFLAGDAVHTHSPKAGQGMNVSIQDSYNLGWKLALVLQGFAQRNLLSTYEQERRAIALELIAFDQHYSRVWSSQSQSAGCDARGPKSSGLFKEAFEKQKLFSSGFAVDYGASILVAKSSDAQSQRRDDLSASAGHLGSKQGLALNIPIGKRFPSARVVNHSDARPWEFAKWLKADGRFRIILFAGDVSNEAQMQRVRRFCVETERLLQTKSEKRVHDLGSWIEVLTIHSATRESIELAEFPELLHPFDEKQGWDYNKIFVDGPSYYESHGEAYRKYGIDRQIGCVVVTRPDQHVCWIGELEGVSELRGFFEGFVAF